MDERGVHNLYKQLVNSGNAFGAKRWVATLDRQCERLASALASNIPTGDVGGKNNIIYSVTNFFSVCMVRKFCVGLCFYVVVLSNTRDVLLKDCICLI